MDPGDLRLRRLRASSVLGEREEESGEQQGARGKARLLFEAAGARGGRSHDANRGRQLRPGRARAVPSRAGKKAALTSGARASAAGHGGAWAVAWRDSGLARLLGCGAAVLGRAGNKGRGASRPNS